MGEDDDIFFVVFIKKALSKVIERALNFSKYLFFYKPNFFLTKGKMSSLSTEYSTTPTLESKI